jgi:hypothetical protein
MTNGAAIDRPQPTRVTFSDSLIKLIVAIFVVPAPFEIVIGVVKRESYDFRRLAIIVGALSVLAALLALMRNRRVYVQSVVGYYLVLAGAAIAAFGIAVTLWSEALLATKLAPWVETTVSALTPSVGLLLVASGVYLIREQHHRIREDLDEPSPENISAPRTIRIKNENASLWRSNIFTTRPGADGIVELCKKHLSLVDLHYVAYYTADGTCLFYVDFLDDDGMAHFDVPDIPNRRRLYEQEGRHLRSVATKLDKRLRALDSGMLIRLVVDVEKGALFYYNIKREGFLIGVTLDQSQVDPADRKMSTLANEILTFRGGRPDDDFYRS